jgi:uncharacterized repeat protein (TIGR02059 family)
MKIVEKSGLVKRLIKYGLGILLVTLLAMLPAVFAPADASAATTSLTITKLASDGTTILEQKTVTFQELRDGMLADGTEIPIMGDGTTHYYHQGPVFIDDPDEETEQMLRWNQAEDTNWDTKDMGALKGTNLTDLCNLVGGMADGDRIKVIASDGWSKYFAYKNVYQYSVDREGPMVVCWYKNGLYPDSGYNEGMRLIWFAAATWKEGPTSIVGLPSGFYNVFGNWDWHEAADPEYWYYYMSGGEKYPTTTGISGQVVAKLTIYSTQAPPVAPVAAFTADVTSGDAPLAVNFTDQSTNIPTSWAWDFDNDGTVDSTVKNPAYTYNTAGTYTVKLTATNAAGSDDEIKADYITVSSAPVAPVAAFTADPTSGPAPLTVNFTDLSTGTAPLTYAWDFDNDSIVDSTDQNPTHEYSAAGTYSVKLTVTNAAGSDEKLKTDYITVTAPPVLTADTTDNTVGQPVDITFTDDAAWRTAITGITVNGSALISQYTVTEGNLNIIADVFAAAGDYAVVVSATGYSDATVTQTMNAVVESPILERAEVTRKGDVNLNFNKAMADPAGIGAEGQFAVLVDGQSVTVTAVVKTSKNKAEKITLTVATKINGGHLVTVAYTKSDDEGKQVKSADGGVLESFSAQSVTNKLRIRR